MGREGAGWLRIGFATVIRLKELKAPPPPPPPDSSGICMQRGGCQNYGPFLGPYYSTAPII